MSEVVAPTADGVTGSTDTRGGLPTEPPPKQSSPVARLVRQASRWAVVVGFLAMVVLFSALRPETFLSLGTVKDVLGQAVVPIILVSGLTFVLVVGEFDLSFTAILGLCAAVVMTLMAEIGVPVIVSVVITLGVAAVSGLLVGLLVTLGRASSFIVTLAIGSVLTGLELAVSNNQNIFLNVPPAYSDFARREILGLHQPVWLMLVIAGLAAVLLHATRFGRHVRAIGGNPVAAYLGGVRVRRARVLCFLLVSVLAGVAAIVTTSKAASYFPNAAAGYLLNSYAAIFLGAAVGRESNFSLAGSAFGVVWLLTLQTGLTQLNQPTWLSSFIQGLVLAAAVLIASRGKRTAA